MSADVFDIVEELRRAPATMIGGEHEPVYWTCQKAADFLLRQQQTIQHLSRGLERQHHKAERNELIAQRKGSGERTIDLAHEYGVSSSAISKIVQRERDRKRKAKA